MPIKRIRTASVPDSTDYLTANKIYLCDIPENGSGFLGRITADDGETHSVYLPGCAHLEGDPWEVLSDEELKK